MTAGRDHAAPEARRRAVAGAVALDEARLQVLRATRRRLALRVPRLVPGLYDSAAMLAECRRIALAGRGAEIRILLHEPAAALRDGHRLLGLVQRLPSIVRVRTPVEATDLECPVASLLDDAGGFVHQPDASQPSARAALGDRPGQAPLLQHFDEAWERAVPATMLRALGL